MKSLLQAPISPFTLHLFYCSCFLTLLPHFVLCIHLSSSPLFFYSLPSLYFLFSCLSSKCSPDFLYFFFYSLFSSLHFLIPAKHGWRLWTCWWLLFRSENQLRNSRDNQCMVLKAARHHFSGWNSSISSLWPGQELQYFSCFLGDPGVHSRGWQQDCR